MRFGKITLYKYPGEKLDTKKEEHLLVDFLLLQFIIYKISRNLMKLAKLEYLSFRRQNGQPFGSQFSRLNGLLVLINQLSFREISKNG